jgi:hypothetical protein
MNGRLNEVHAMLDQLARTDFFGSVTFQFKGGKVVLIRREETLLPSQAAPKDSGRTEHEHQP